MVLLILANNTGHIVLECGYMGGDISCGGNAAWWEGKLTADSETGSYIYKTSKHAPTESRDPDPEKSDSRHAQRVAAVFQR